MLEHLKSSFVSKSKIDSLEQENISKALLFLDECSFSLDDFLTVSYLKGIHKRMFQDVWDYAGIFRKENLNIGLEDFYSIPMELYNRIENVKWRLGSQEVDLVKDLGKFHHHQSSLELSYENVKKIIVTRSSLDELTEDSIWIMSCDSFLKQLWDYELIDVEQV